MNDAIFVGGVHTKIYRVSGITDTIVDSVSTTTIDTNPFGLSWDGNNCRLSGWQTYKLYQLLGISTTVVDSISTVAFAALINGVGWDGNTPRTCITDFIAKNLLDMDGWSSTVNDSVSVGSIDNQPYGVTTNETGDPYWTGLEAGRLYRQDGFTSTITDSVSVSSLDTLPMGITWTGAETVFTGDQLNILWRLIGFTDTVNDFASLGGIDGSPRDVTWSDYGGRMANPETPRPAQPIQGKATARRRQPSSIRVFWPQITSDILDNYPPPAVRVYRPILRRRGATPVPVRIMLVDFAHHYLDARGRYRIFNDAEYRFYRSDGSPPDEADSPFATSSTLPSTPADTYADGEWYLSMSYFNGLVDSGFLPVGPNGETYLRVDIDSGDQQELPPQAPLAWWLEQSLGTVTIKGFYWEPGALRADQFSLNYALDGGSPLAGVTLYSTTIPSSGLAWFSYDLGPYIDGREVSVLLQTRRAIDGGWVYSEDNTVQDVVVDLTGPAAVGQAEQWAGKLPEEYREWLE